MPRYLPPLASEFRAECHRLRDFASRLEQNHNELKRPNARLTLSGLQLSYELIYLKMFLSWEDFLEQVFLRLLCGVASNGGVEPLVPGLAFAKSIDEAGNMVLAGREFQLWHNPEAIVRRSDRFFAGQHSYFRQIVASNQDSLTNYAAVRHRIAHNQAHARGQFDDATMAMAGRRYPGSAAGRFLRELESDLPPRRWLDYIAEDLYEIAHQLC